MTRRMGPGEHDHSSRGEGGAVLSPEELSRNRSYRHGSTVYYDPRARGPYVDGQDALADVPAGGLLVLGSTEYDVATEGRLTTDRDGITIKGSGFHLDNNDNLYGTVVRNDGGDVIDAPAIEISGTAKDERSKIADLSVVSEAPTSAGIRWNNVVFNITTNVHVDGSDAGTIGIEYAGESFFSRSYDTKVVNTLDKGFYVEYGAGFDFEFYGCQASLGSGNTNANAVAFDSERHGVWLYGGQYDVSSSVSGGVGVQFNQTQSSIKAGGGCWGVASEASETGYRVKADGTGRFSEIRFIECFANLGASADGFLVGDSTHVVVQQPAITNPGGGGNAVRFTTNALHPVYIMPRDGYNAPVSDGGATRPLVFINWTVADGLLNNMTLGGVPAYAPFHSSQLAPVWNDGSSWNVASHTTFTP